MINVESEDLDKILRVVKELSYEERKVLEYMIHNPSVGEIIAIRELRSLYKIENPELVLAKLIELGLVERGLACYNLSRTLRKLIKERKLRLHW